MPTPLQVRYHFGKIARLCHRLQLALNDAHVARVIDYKDYSSESPCSTLHETWERVKKTSEKQLAEAMREEIRKKK